MQHKSVNDFPSYFVTCTWHGLEETGLEKIKIRVFYGVLASVLKKILCRRYTKGNKICYNNDYCKFLYEA